MAREHYDLENKKKPNIRRTDTSSASSTSKKKDIKKIHVLIESLLPEETKELVALQSASREKENDLDFKEENCIDVSVSYYSIYCPMFSSLS